MTVLLPLGAGHLELRLPKTLAWKWEGTIMRKATRCWAISARAVSGSLMSSAGATTMPQPMLSGSQMSMTLPSVGQGS